MRTRARFVICLLTLAVVMVSGCANSGVVPSKPQVLNAAALTALGARNTKTTLAATPLAQIPFVAQLIATLPKPAAVSGTSTGEVDAALHFAAKVVGATHFDPAVICGSDTERRAAMKRFSVDATKTWIDDQKNVDGLDAIAPGLAELASRASTCADFRLVGPGVVLGPQSWTVRPGDSGNDLWVDYAGVSTLLFANGAGHVTPLSAEYRASYSLTKASKGQWALMTWDDYFYKSLTSIANQVPVPSSYMPIVPAGTLSSDSKALASVHAAMAQWAGSAAAVVITRSAGKKGLNKATSSATPEPAPSSDAYPGYKLRMLPDGTEEYTWTELVAPSRGDSRVAGIGPLSGFTIRRGTEWYSPADRSKSLTAVPFTHGNPKAKWFHGIVGGLDGSSLAPNGSWDWYDLLTTAEAAAEMPCPAVFTDSASRPVTATDSSASVCYAVSVRTGPGVRLTSVGGTLATMASSGRGVFTFTVGLDTTGRLTQATASAEQMLFGQRVAQATTQSWFPKPTVVAPAAPQPPAAADTANSADFY